MLKILVTGAKGQLGSEFEVLSSEYKEYKFTFVDKLSLDITDEENLKNYFEKNSFDTIINCAAYTNVDKAEENEKFSQEVNQLAVKYLSKLCVEYSMQLIHFSTDYVFDGKNNKPYLENDNVSPCNIYGKTKFLGEQEMVKISPLNSVIIRTSWVYSSFGNNFVKTMLRLGSEKESLNVIDDQIGSPTYANDLAKMILEILPKIDNKEVEIYNYSNEGALSWYNFSKEIMRMSNRLCEINPIESKDYPTLATRPYYSLLSKSKIKKTFSIDVPYWKDSLEACLKVMRERT